MTPASQTKKTSTRRVHNVLRADQNKNTEHSTISNDMVFYQSCLPVTGASMSIMVFSCRRSAAPSLMIRNATSSVTRPSRMKCCFRTSGLGLPLASKASLIVTLWLGGNGTAESEKENTRRTRSVH